MVVGGVGGGGDSGLGKRSQIRNKYLSKIK